ncbi:MAG: iron export ABC transporter permease subunit FetB [Acidimicrobiales bacterium]
MSSDVGFVGLALSTVMIAVAVGISLGQRLGLERSMLWASLRALVQLLVVGTALDLVIDPKRPLGLSWCWVVAMIVFAAFTTSRRAKEVPGAFGLSLAAYGAATAVTLAVILGLGVFPTNGRTIVPLSGMVVGNSLSATVLVGRRIVAEFADKRLEVEARLALGRSNREAAAPYLREAVRTALIPQIETTKATGIVFLPGAMVGLILAGVKPIDAVKVQGAVMFLILGAVATTTSIIAIGLSRRLFTHDGRVVRLRRAA